LDCSAKFSEGHDFNQEIEEEDEDPIPAVPAHLPATSAPPKGKETITAPVTDASTDSAMKSTLAAMLNVVTAMNDRMSTLESKVTAGPSTSTARPAVKVTTTPSIPKAPEVLQAEVNEKVLQTLKQLLGDEPKTTPAPTQVLPKHVLEEILKLHDYPNASYTQQAVTQAVKALLDLYNQGILMGPDDPMHTVAHHLSVSIQDAMVADAFPANQRPLMKEKKTILQQVLAGRITKAEIEKGAYTHTGYSRGSSNYTTRGRGRSSWSPRGRTGTGRGRGRSGRGGYHYSGTENQNTPPTDPH